MRLALASALVVAGVVAVFGSVVFTTYSAQLNSGSDDHLKDFLTVFVIAGASAILLAVLFGWLGARSASKCLTGMTAQLAGLADGRRDLSTRVELSRGRTETGELSQALNASLARIEVTSQNLERALGDQRHFLGEAARRLRTPLTSLATSLQVLRRQPDMAGAERDSLIERSLGHVEAMRGLVDGLDLLARMGAGEGLHREPFAWASVLETAATRGRHICAPRPIGIEVSPELDTGWGDVGALQELLRILFTNVAAHAPETATVTFGASPSPQGNTDELTVADDGPGVPPALRERMFEPFVTGNPGRDAGLGLAVARSIALSHGGSIDAEPNSPRGLRVRVLLPRKPA